MFFPRNCPGNREPADMAWVYGSDVILFYMTGGKKSRLKQDQHNLRQAKWWVRNWSDKNPLESEDGINSFKRSEISGIYVCLICDAPEDDVFYIGIDRLSHIDGMCSFSVRFALNFFAFYPNAHDLIGLMRGSTDVDGASEEIALQSLRMQYADLFHSGALTVSNTYDNTGVDIFLESDLSIKMIKEEIAKQGEFQIDLSFADVAWISGALFAGTQHVVDGHRSHGELRYAWAKHTIRERTFIILVTSSVIGSDDIFKTIVKENKSTNFLLICKWGGLPVSIEAWSYLFGLSLDLDPRAAKISDHASKR